ncbi:phospholipase effector Tle1 domain-containing protein [Phyllobacterium sp. K27]
MIHMIGLLAPDQLNLGGHALRSYKQASDERDLSVAWHFSKVSGARDVPIKFLGVWDTVASVLVPRKDRVLPQLLMLPYTRTNPSVEIFRHAMAIDEHRRMFRLNRWIEPQPFVADPFDTSAPDKQQDIKQVWFTGCHSDIGGGYAESQSALSKFPLDWMIDEAAAYELKINGAMRERLVFGGKEGGAIKEFVSPDPTGKAHDSMTWGWRPLEWIPKSSKWQEWPRPSLGGFYLPRAEPRKIDNDIKTPIIHQSVVDRKSALLSYDPENLPHHFDDEPYSDRLKQHLGN